MKREVEAGLPVGRHLRQNCHRDVLPMSMR